MLICSMPDYNVFVIHKTPPSPSQDSPSTVNPSSKIAALTALLGSIVSLVGVYLPWVQERVLPGLTGFTSYDVAGWGGTGRFVAVSAILTAFLSASLLMRHTTLAAAFLMVLAAGQLVWIVLIAWSLLNGSLGAFGPEQPIRAFTYGAGPGIYLSGLGSALALCGSLLAIRQRKLPTGSLAS
jgi:hypothetical protein